MKSPKDYLELFNKINFLLLADVFENFRSVCLDNYYLEPSHYYTAPGLAYDAELKITGIKLELLSDYDMLLMVEEGTRGGVNIRGDERRGIGKLGNIIPCILEVDLDYLKELHDLHYDFPLAPEQLEVDKVKN